MTKMSSARVKRTIAQKQAKKDMQNNTCWDDLNGLHADGVILMQKHLVIAGMLRNKELNAFLTDVEAVKRNGQLLAKDVATLTEDLAGLKALHADKTGGTQDPDVLIHCIGIYEQYQLFMSRHEAIIMPTVGAILEQYHVAEERLNAAASAGYDALAEIGQAALDEKAPAEGEFVEMDNAQPAALRQEYRQTNVGGAGEAQYEPVPKDEQAQAEVLH